MMAIERHKPMTKNAVLEAVLNLGLSLVLIKTIGLYGVAWGTSISMAFTHLIFWPGYIQKVLGVSRRTYIWQGWARITLAAVPYAVACAMTERYWHPAHLVTFFAQILAVLPVYVLSVLVVFRQEAKQAFAKWRASRPSPVLQAS
jgi:O-antigen/teichoic acid export membrane protein